VTDTSSAEFTTISRQISPDSLLGVSAGIYQLWWMNQE
jgi:hypothetical protein